MANDGTTGSKTKYTEQHIENMSYDQRMQLASRLLMGYDDTVGAEGTRRVAVNPNGQLEVSTQPINPISGDNPSVTVTENISGTITTKTITKIINAISYIKTVAIDSSDNSVSVSVWSQA